MVGEQGHWSMPMGKPLDEAVVQEFAADLRGRLLRPEDDGYDTARAVFNGMVDKRPAMLARGGRVLMGVFSCDEDLRARESALDVFL